MHISELDYDLPGELIAQEPARPRDSSRLLVLDRPSGHIEHLRFCDLTEYLQPGDVVVLNDTQVIRARLRGRRQPGGGRAEILLLAQHSESDWEALVTPGRRMQPGRRIIFGDGSLCAEILDRTPSGSRLLRFSSASDLSTEIARAGEMPTPPYIHRPIDRDEDYQTVYARAPGASAAPTAGLHFTPAILDAVRSQVSAVVTITLHVGLGTFRPIHTERVEDHDMHAESYSISQNAADVISQAMAEDKRIVAVGTSTARALEAAFTEGGIISGEAATKLFILPGYHFRIVGALLTNFHLPRSTLLALICAFAGRDNIFRAYREAIDQKYRFLSFGDAMFIT